MADDFGFIKILDDAIESLKSHEFKGPYTVALPEYRAPTLKWWEKIYKFIAPVSFEVYLKLRVYEFRCLIKKMRDYTDRVLWRGSTI